MRWNNLHNVDVAAASEEAARKYYSTKQFLVTGVQNVFPSPPIPSLDNRFFDVLYYMDNGGKKI